VSHCSLGQFIKFYAEGIRKMELRRQNVLTFLEIMLKN